MLDKNAFRYVDFDPLIRKGPLAGQAGTITPQLDLQSQGLDLIS
jgi:hypothetical protein